MVGRDALTRTRRSLHGVAELVLAAPQRAASGTIRLQPTAGGFGTTRAPDLRVEGTDLVAVTIGGLDRVGIDGRTAADLLEELGLPAADLADVYSGGSSVALGERLAVDGAAAHTLAAAFAVGQEALEAFAPTEAPVLWPEHFDLAVTVDRVNYGVSPGDDHLAVPYAYVGPWATGGLTGDFWNAPFGAARPLAELSDVLAFFEEGRSVAASYDG